MYNKCVFSKNITDEIKKEDFLEDDNKIPTTIIYDEHKYILFAKNLIQQKKIIINVHYGGVLGIKKVLILVFVKLQ